MGLNEPETAAPEDDGADAGRDPTLPPGTRFGAYTVERCIGRGGMGAVYEARHRELGKRVALKALHRRVADDARARARFLAEGRATSRLRHPHVVDVSDHGILDGVPFLVMEYLEGETLADLLAREGALPVGRSVEILLPVCAAMSATHLEGIVHRDLKPANIFLSRDGLGREQVKVLDFGVSKSGALEVDELTATGALLGTPWYMSPEQAQDPRNAQAASDQYALGVILAECLTGRRAFEGRSLYLVLRAIVTGQMRRPRELRPDLPEDLEAVVLRAASVDISARFASVDDLARALLPFAPRHSCDSWRPLFGLGDERDPVRPAAIPATAPAAVPAPVDDSEPARRPSRGRPRAPVLAAVAGVTVVAVALGAWALRPTALVRPPTAASAPASSTSTAATPVAAPRPTATGTPAASVPAAATPAAPAPAAATHVVALRPPPVVPRPAARPRPPARVARRQLGANGAPIEE